MTDSHERIAPSFKDCLYAGDTEGMAIYRRHVPWQFLSDGGSQQDFFASLGTKGQDNTKQDQALALLLGWAVEDKQSLPFDLDTVGVYFAEPLLSLIQQDMALSLTKFLENGWDPRLRMGASELSGFEVANLLNPAMTRVIKTHFEGLERGPGATGADDDFQASLDWSNFESAVYVGDVSTMAMYRDNPPWHGMEKNRNFMNHVGNQGADNAAFDRALALVLGWANEDGKDFMFELKDQDPKAGRIYPQPMLNILSKGMGASMVEFLDHGWDPAAPIGRNGMTGYEAMEQMGMPHLVGVVHAHRARGKAHSLIDELDAEMGLKVPGAKP